MLKKIAIVLILILAAFQFYPRATKNQGNTATGRDILTLYPAAPEVAGILKTSCYDCHSNYTAYPWYAQIQPLNLWLNHHVEEGKEALNMSEFGKYSKEDQLELLEEMNEEVKEGEMPLNSYTLIHRNAILKQDQKLALANWTSQYASRNSKEND